LYRTQAPVCDAFLGSALHAVPLSTDVSVKWVKAKIIPMNQLGMKESRIRITSLVKKIFSQEKTS
jgi:hypothetical protein